MTSTYALRRQRPEVRILLGAPCSSQFLAGTCVEQTADARTITVQGLAERLRAIAVRFRLNGLDKPLCYFVGPAEGPIKIGFASNFSERWRHLRNESPQFMQIYATAPGNRVTEREYHSRFKADRLHGEWFNPSEALLTEIERLNGMPSPSHRSLDGAVG